MEALNCRPGFIKVFLPNLCSEYLRIPPAFQKHMKGCSSGIVSLKGPSGNTWNVELVAGSDGLRFENGWKKFVSDHTLTKGDLLEFSLKKPLYFSVKVFDLTTCEKEATFMVIPSPTSVATDIRQDEEEESVIVVETGELHAQVSFSNANQGKQGRKFKRMSSLAIMESPQQSTSTSLSRILKRPKISTTAAESCTIAQVSTRKLLGKDLHDKEHRLAKAVPLSQPRHVISQRRLVTVEEVKNCLQRAESFKTHNPSFLIKMQESYVYKRLCLMIPRAFWKAHMLNISQKLVLWDPKGKPWPVKHVMSGIRSSFGSGWAGFSLANNLEKYDVCVFELFEGHHFKVHIFRVVEEIMPLKRHSAVSPFRKGVADCLW